MLPNMFLFGNSHKTRNSRKRGIYIGRAEAAGELITNEVIRTHSISKKDKILFVFINEYLLSV